MNLIFRILILKLFIFLFFVFLLQINPSNYSNLLSNFYKSHHLFP